ncbi:MarR family transcriptional regulator [Pseudooceanicola sp.]|uniref:MarR family winged helix-turn-helix transcriptional regulator n=1 Tax=Pseudooceanicola sp. TaxID=1914328 RepID=UPI002613D2E5|nr:MarR family transcriptional regulator [Pseudooceanicola sp.]MDF1854850.1 MarR family transcriptional regulator [Pseudooceanicola sp.]
MPDTAYRLHDSPGYRLSIAARQQERRLDEGLRPLGLTRITWCVLLAVGNEGLCQPSDIAQFIGIDRTATSRALRLLESNGLLDRTSGEGDRRTRRVTLTEAGTRALAAGGPIARDNATRMAARLDPADQVVLKQLIDRELRDLKTL